MKRTCQWVAVVFTTAYGLALILFLIGTFGLFGEEKDPLSGVFLLPLGLPWNQFLDGFSGTARAVAAAAAPLVNILILFLLCRLVPGRNQS